MSSVTNVYCDGSCLNNGKANATGGIGIWFSEDDPRNVSEQFTLETPTNNRAELYALQRTFKILQNETGIINIYSDSEYSIKSLTVWITNWKKNNWKNSKKKPVVNKELIIDTYNAYKLNNFNLIHVYAHTKGIDSHSIGNAHADNLATQASNYFS